MWPGCRRPPGAIVNPPALTPQDVGGRRLLVVWHKDQLYAVDSHCYHMGGDLEEGDIEDVDQHACVVCPLHRHRVGAGAAR